MYGPPRSMSFPKLLVFIVLTILEIRVADVYAPFLLACRVPTSHVFTSSSDFAGDFLLNRAAVHRQVCALLRELRRVR
jgi:hypothetical protein